MVDCLKRFTPSSPSKRPPEERHARDKDRKEDGDDRTARENAYRDPLRQIGLAYDHALEAEGLNDAQGAHDRKRDGEDPHLSRREKPPERPTRQTAARKSWHARSPSTLSSP
jgi:hypothetical protein